MEVSVKLVRVFFGIATGFFRALSCWGGGGVVCRSRENMCLRVTVDIVGRLYFSHSIWPDQLLG